MRINILVCITDHQPKGDDEIADVTNKPLWGSQRAAAGYHFQSGSFKALVAFAFFKSDSWPQVRFRREARSFLPALSNRGGIGKIYLNETHPGTRGRFRAGQWRPLEVRPPQGALAVGRQATGDPPARNSRSSAPGEQLERWVALTQMRSAREPGPRIPGPRIPPVLTSG